MDPDFLISNIEDIADPLLQAPWDKSGMQVVCGRKEFNHIAVMLDPVPKQVHKALSIGCDFILSHHPLALKPELPSKDDNYYKVLRLLMAADVPLYAAHTSLDVNLKGPAGWLGRALHLYDCRPLEVVAGQNDGYGYGETGYLPENMNLGELIKKILNLVDIEWAISTCEDYGRVCSRVAYCGGSGGSLISAAAAAGADIYITGDIKYHAALEAQLPILDVGHHGIEEKMMRVFCADLEQRLPGIKITFVPSSSPFCQVRQ